MEKYFLLFIRYSPLHLSLFMRIENGFPRYMLISWPRKRDNLRACSKYTVYSKRWRECHDLGHEKFRKAPRKPTDTFRPHSVLIVNVSSHSKYISSFDVSTYSTIFFFIRVVRPIFPLIRRMKFWFIFSKWGGKMSRIMDMRISLRKMFWIWLN